MHFYGQSLRTTGVSGFTVWLGLGRESGHLLASLLVCKTLSGIKVFFLLVSANILSVHF